MTDAPLLFHPERWAQLQREDMRRVEFGTWNPFLGGGRSISLFANPNEHDLSTLSPILPYDQSDVSFVASKEKGGSKLDGFNGR